jgi:hypothetical protein
MSACRALPLAQAARDLAISASALRTRFERGAPTVRPGTRGPGNGALVDPEAHRRWAASPDAASTRERLEQLAERFRAFFRAGGHRNLGWSDEKTQLYLAALFEDIATKEGEEHWADEHPLFAPGKART